MGVEICVEAQADVAGVEEKAAADGFEKGFFQGPKLEEVGRLAVGGEGGEVADFVWAEDVGGDVVAGEAGVDELEINAYGVLAGDDDGGEIAGVGDVELPAGGGGERGLALGLVAEGDFLRRKAGVGGEEETEAGAAGDEAGVVFLEGETGGAVLLGRGEEGGEIVEGGFGGCERNFPDVGLAGEERRGSGEIQE